LFPIRPDLQCLYLEGSIEPEDLEGLETTLHKMTILRKESEGFSLMIDGSKLVSMTREAIETLRLCLSELANAEVISEVIWVLPSSQLHSLATPLSARTSLLPFSIHPTLLHALRSLSSRIAARPLPQNRRQQLGLTTAFGAHWKTQDHLLVHGQLVPLHCPPSWQCQTDSGALEQYLVADRLLLLRCVGETLTPSPEGQACLKQSLPQPSKPYVAILIDLSGLSTCPASLSQWLRAALAPQAAAGTAIVYLLPPVIGKLEAWLFPQRPLRFRLFSVSSALGYWLRQPFPSMPASSQLPKPTMLNPIESYTKEELYALAHQAQVQLQATPRAETLEQYLNHLLQLQSPPEIPATTSPVIRAQLELLTQKFQSMHGQQLNLEALIDQTSDGILVFDESLTLQLINRTMARLAQRIYRGRWQVGASLPQLLPPAAITYWQRLWKAAFNGRQIQTIARSSNQPGCRFYEYLLFPIRDGQNHIHSVAFSCKDVTAVHRANLKLQQKQHLLESVFYSVQEGIFRTRPGKGIVFVNQMFVDMFGYDSAEEMLPLDPYVLYENPRRRDDFVNLVQQQEGFRNQAVLFKRKDGSTFHGLISSKKTIEEDGTVYHDGAIRDVTDLKEFERQLKEHNYQLKQVNKQLKKVNHELDKFVYSTSHDLRAPVVTLAGLINISRMTEDPDEKAHYGELMEQSVDKLDQFIRNIIGYSRNASNDMKREVINFQRLIDHSLEQLESLPQFDQVQCEVEIKAEQPYFSDPDRLQLIFTNLLSNAVRYYDPEKAHPWVKLTVSVKENTLHLSCADNGIGIQSQYLDRIFEMFYRASSRSKGSGIGLYIAKEAVSRLGGLVLVESEPGKGSTFKLELPEVAEVRELSTIWKQGE